MQISFKCKHCGNTDSRYIIKRGAGETIKEPRVAIYCLKCKEFILYTNIEGTRRMRGPNIDRHIGCPSYPNCKYDPNGCCLVMGSDVEMYAHKD